MMKRHTEGVRAEGDAAAVAQAEGAQVRPSSRNMAGGGVERPGAQHTTSCTAAPAAAPAATDGAEAARCVQVRMAALVCRQEMLTGHTHLAVAIVQAMLEYHCFAPPPLGAPRRSCARCSQATPCSRVATWAQPLPLPASSRPIARGLRCNTPGHLQAERQSSAACFRHSGTPHLGWWGSQERPAGQRRRCTALRPLLAPLADQPPRRHCHQVLLSPAQHVDPLLPSGWQGPHKLPALAIDMPASCQPGGSTRGQAQAGAVGRGGRLGRAEEEDLGGWTTVELPAAEQLAAPGTGAEGDEDQPAAPHSDSSDEDEAAVDETERARPPGAPSGAGCPAHLSSM